jgi:cell division protein FtsB
MKKFFFFFTVIVCLIIINNLVHSIVDTWQKQKYVVEAQNSLKLEQQHHAQLDQQLKKISQKQYVEEQARDKLLLVKPGEEIVLMPSNIPSSAPTSQSLADTNKPHWQEWWEYFFQ